MAEAVSRQNHREQPYNIIQSDHLELHNQKHRPIEYLPSFVTRRNEKSDLHMEITLTQGIDETFVSSLETINQIESQS